MSIYWIIVAAVILLGLIIPQQGYYRKIYVILMAALHIFVCGFRYMYLTGDLRKYAWNYYESVEFSWFSPEILQEGRNTGWFMLQKLLATISNGDFQFFLFVLAVIMIGAVSVMIYRYSPQPWLSFLIYNCLALYTTYGFSAIKQGLAMAILIGAMMCIMEKKPRGFLWLTLLAGFVHMPALCFLPAYWLANRQINVKTMIIYVAAAAVIFVFREQIIDLIAEFYYEEDEFQLLSKELGGRFMVIALMLLCGIMLKGFREKHFSQLFNMIVVAAVFQMFSNFDNVFTRLADYYLQFTVLYIPMIFYDSTANSPVNERALRPLLPFNRRSMNLIVAMLVLVLIWWYDTTCLGVTITYEVDNYLNYRSMWDVLE